MTVKIKDKVTDSLKRLRLRLANMGPVYALIGETILESIQRTFQEQGRPEKWTELSPVTKSIREKMGKWPGQILMVRGGGGGLLGSINYNVLPRGVRVAANKVYARVMDQGAEAGELWQGTMFVRAHTRMIQDGETQVQVQVRAHERRGKSPWGRIVGRKFMQVLDEDWVTINGLLDGHFFG